MSDSKLTGVPLTAEAADSAESTTTTDQDVEGDDAPRKSSSWGRWLLGLVWDSVEGDARNKRYVQKLDNYLFTYICFGYFIKTLDQTNYSNAFVSGMQKDLSLYGNERNWLNTWFSLGIIIGTVPAQLIQLRALRPSLFIPLCEFVWSVLVMCMAAAKNIETLYALRFFIGLLEACSFPGYSSLLGGWYGPNELSKRVAIFEQTSAIAGMFSGYLQAGLYTGLNGVHGIAGWRWLFIMDGIISIPIAIWGFFAIPDLPHTTRAFYWSEDDKKYGVQRIEKMGRIPPEKLTLQALRKVYTNWRLWVFILPYLMVAEAGTGTSYFNLWLQSAGYSVVDINIYPTFGNVISIVVSFIFGILADRTGKRVLLLFTIQLLVLTSNIMLSVWYIPKSALLFAFYLSYIGAASQPIVIAWGHHIHAGDPNLRQLLVASGNIFTYTFTLFLPLVLFPTYDAPRYKYGYQILILFGGLAIFGIWFMQWTQKKDLERKTRTNSASESPQTALAEEQSTVDYIGELDLNGAPVKRSRDETGAV